MLLGQPGAPAVLPAHRVGEVAGQRAPAVVGQQPVDTAAENRLVAGPIRAGDCGNSPSTTMLAVAVRVGEALAWGTRVASGEPDQFDRALAAYRQVVDCCTLRAP